MAFTAAELWQIKRELGYNLLNTGATAYVGVSQLLEQVVNENIEAEVATTSTLATAISAAASPAPQTLTLTSASGFASGAVVYVDVDSRQERATIQSLSGSDIVVQIQKAHSGTIPVSLDGPIPMARECLREIRNVKSEMSSTLGEGAIKQVDEVEFFRHGSRTGQFGALGAQLAYWRNELASILGMPNLWERRGATSLSVY